jgi:ferredoxin
MEAMIAAGSQAASRGRAKGRKLPAIDYELCHCCGACVAVCPADALYLADTRLEVRDSCTGCGRCAKICPMRALTMAEANPA